MTARELRQVCIHGHFYQPPRENPWLEFVEVEDSAAPYHDWNERIDAECYAANAASRLQTDRGRLTAIVRNYDRISFNFGPTLLAWMERASLRTYHEILDADRESVLRFGGHGNAVAQGYNHAILPLCSERDRRTQVRWGCADFRARFGRDPEGMWLPEAAVDTPTLEALAAEGLRFTILSPRQARAVSPVDREAWIEVNESTLDTTQAYRCDLPSGRSLAVFFYDGALAQGVAFGGLLDNGGAFAHRLAGAFPARLETPRLVHVATDGESYGHHHRFGDMALAYALRDLEEHHDVTLTNYGRFLDLCPPARRVRIWENSSWSCAHGVERWRADCGCRIGGERGWTQAWRAPLRAALDRLKGDLDRIFESHGGRVLADPWAARDAYVDLVRARTPDAVQRFLAQHGRGPLDEAGRTEALRALEMQRGGMLMFTSCGWFFDDVAGLETAQILKYACRAAGLARQLCGEDLETPLVQALEAARSNVPAEEHGASVYRRRVRPLAVDLHRVAAHHALWSVMGPGENNGETHVYAYEVRRLDWSVEEYAGTRLAAGRFRVTAQVTRETEEVALALLHFGGHDFRCDVRPSAGPPEFRRLRDDLLEKFDRHSLSDVVTAFNRHFGETGWFTLRDAFIEERRRILDRVVSTTQEELESAYLGFYREHGRLLAYLADSSYPLPDALRVAVEFAIVREVEALVASLGSTPPDGVDSLDSLALEAQRLGRQVVAWGVRPPRERLRRVLTDSMLHQVGRFDERPQEAPLRVLHQLLDVAGSLHLEFDRWRVQNAAFRALTDPSWPARVGPVGLAERADLDAGVVRLAERLDFVLARVSRM